MKLKDIMYTYILTFSIYLKNKTLILPSAIGATIDRFLYK